MFDLSDRITVMLQGKLVGTVNKDDVTKDEVLAMIIIGKKPGEVSEKELEPSSTADARSGDRPGQRAVERRGERRIQVAVGARAPRRRPLTSGPGDADGVATTQAAAAPATSGNQPAPTAASSPAP